MQIYFPMNTTIIIIINIIGLWLFLYLVPIGTWLKAMLHGVKISLLELILMRYRKVPTLLIVDNLITVNYVELDISRQDLETLYISGGDVENVVHGMIHAIENDIPLSFKDACSLDKKGYNVTEMVENEKNCKLFKS